MKGRLGTSRALVCTSGDTMLLISGVLTLSAGGSIVCGVMAIVGHNGKSLAGKVDPQPFFK